MDEKTAHERANEILAWLEVNGEEAGALAPMVQGQCNYLLSLDDDKNRGKVWAAIREMLGTLDNSPIKRGKGSSLTAEQQAVVSNVENRIMHAFANIGEWDLIQQVFPESTKKGQYADAQAFGEHMARKAGNNMKTAIREERFTGLFDGDSQNITIIPAEPSQDAESEEAQE